MRDYLHIFGEHVENLALPVSLRQGVAHSEKKVLFPLHPLHGQKPALPCPSGGLYGIVKQIPRGGQFTVAVRLPREVLGNNL